MKSALGIFILSMVLLSSEALAAVNIRWEQPEVIPEALVRPNRRVLRFSGVTKPGTQVRVRDNKVKMIFSGGTIRWAHIPKKHRVQFPVIASETGFFSFDLYLPTTAVEIPLEIFSEGRWKPYAFSFDVPNEGQADRFDFKESFKIRDEGPVEDFLAEYDRAKDRGQVVDRDNRKSWVSEKIAAWVGIGFTYASLSQDMSTNLLLTPPGTLSDVGFPSGEIGGVFNLNQDWAFELSYLIRNAEMSEDGNYVLQNKDFEWNELRFDVVYHPAFLSKGSSRFGVIAGLHRHDLPYLSPAGVNEYRLFGNSVTFVSAGGSYEVIKDGGWNFDARLMLLYPALVGDSFDIDTGYGLYAGFKVLKELIPAFYLGGKVDMHWLQIEHSFNYLGTPIQADMNLWHISPSVILKTEF